MAVWVVHTAGICSSDGNAPNPQLGGSSAAAPPASGVWGGIRESAGGRGVDVRGPPSPPYATGPLSRLSGRIVTGAPPTPTVVYSSGAPGPVVRVSGLVRYASKSSSVPIQVSPVLVHSPWWALPSGRRHGAPGSVWTTWSHVA